jgi:Golgi SNAP receptor complex protein 1
MSLNGARTELFRGSQPRPSLDSRFDILAAEHESIRASSDMLDNALELGLSTNERLAKQGQMIAHSTSNLQQLAAKVPIIGALTGKIDVKRKRDRMILGSLIGVLGFFFVWYLFG